jgi:hypothetical protein
MLEFQSSLSFCDHNLCTFLGLPHSLGSRVKGQGCVKSHAWVLQKICPALIVMHGEGVILPVFFFKESLKLHYFCSQLFSYEILKTEIIREISKLKFPL